ncbi:MAG: hypothetical protein ACK4G1_06225 [Ignavibacteria bacterium]
MSDSIQKTEIFLEEFKKFSSRELKHELDVFNLIETIFRIDNFQLLEDLAFASKYCVGLYNILGQSQSDVSEDYKKEITKSFSETVEQIKSKLDEIISNFSEFDRQSFKTRFFEMSQSGMSNLFSLITDFSEIKLFLNQRKRMREN